MGAGTGIAIMGMILVGGFIVYLIYDPAFMVSCSNPEDHVTADGNCCPPGYNSDGTQCVEGIADYIPSGPFDSFGEVRNCIKRVMANYPDCSDTSGRILPTTCNGKDIGRISFSQAANICR